MKNLDRRELLHTSLALTVPFGSMSLLSGWQQDNKANKKEKSMKVQYLEIVTPKVDELCEQYSKMHGVKFGKPIPEFGNARTTKLSDGGMIGIRGPLRATEKPVIRPYVLVENLEKAVAAAAESGAEVAIPSMSIPGQGATIAIVIQGGIECGLWKND